MNNNKNSLKLIFPQWQGGDNPPYFFGAQLLEWLAPKTIEKNEKVFVPTPDSNNLEVEDGIVGKKILLRQLDDAYKKIEKHNPDSIVVLGGDCLVDLAPFSYLSEKYGDELAVLWVDAHPDIMTPEQFEHAHAHVLANLLGRGDSDFTKYVKKPLKSENICYLGVNNQTEWENSEMKRLGLKNISPYQIRREGSKLLIDWIKSTKAKYIAIHFDLDVLDATLFDSVLFAKPDATENEFEGIAQGQMKIEEIVHILDDVNNSIEVVGLGITEYLPWGVIQMKNMLERLPLIGYEK